MSTPGVERKHSKFSASGASRWMACPGSIALSEGLPDQESPWSLEGTKAHEVLEAYLLNQDVSAADKSVTREMRELGLDAANFIKKIRYQAPNSKLLVEQRVPLDFIHPEAFGSLDAAVIDYFGTLHIFDYKFGRVLVDPEENPQFIFYALAVAKKCKWNFKRVRMWTLQPRVKNFDGFVFWEIGILKLKSYIPIFRAAVEEVEQNPAKLKEGDHCHWCKARGICPVKQNRKLEVAKTIFLKREEGHEKTNKKETFE